MKNGQSIPALIAIAALTVITGCDTPQEPVAAQANQEIRPGDVELVK